MSFWWFLISRSGYNYFLLVSHSKPTSQPNRMPNSSHRLHSTNTNTMTKFGNSVTTTKSNESFNHIGNPRTKFSNIVFVNKVVGLTFDLRFELFESLTSFMRNNLPSRKRRRSRQLLLVEWGHQTKKT